MARQRAKKAETATETQEAEQLPPGATDFDPAELERQAPAVVQQMAEATPQGQEQTGNGHAGEHAPAGNGHAATVERKKYTPPKDPFGFESLKANGNRVRLLKSERHGAWVIRFDHNPNQ